MIILIGIIKIMCNGANGLNVNSFDGVKVVVYLTRALF